MKVDDEMVDRLAELARLEFAGEEKQNIKKDLEQMIGFVERLNELKLDDVQPLIYITDETNVLREDVVEEHVTHAEALSNVPLKDSDYIKVPKVIKK